jgi:chaperonin GroEL
VLDREASAPIITKDGVTIASEIKFKDRYMNMGAQLVKEVSRNTAAAAGDGTTTSTILADAIYREGLRSVENGASPIEIKRGIDKAVDAICKKLNKIAFPIETTEEVAQVGAISANNERWIGDLIANAMDQIGPEGVITVQDGLTPETFVDITEGMRFKKGYQIESMLTNIEALKGEYEDVAVLYFNGKLMARNILVPLMNELSKHPKFGTTTFLLIADVFGPQVLELLEHNSKQGNCQVIPVVNPGVSNGKADALRDMAALTGGKVVGADVPDFKLEYLGTAEKVIMTSDHTTIIDGVNPIELQLDYVEKLKAQREKAPSAFDKEYFSERIARIAGGIAVIHVGGRSDAAITELKHRIEDALGATQAAVEGGIVPGGGTALAKLALRFDIDAENDDQELGATVIRKACEAPLRQILENAGIEPPVILAKVRESADWFDGYDAKANVLTNLKESGIIDPAMVTKLALANAASIAGLLLTTEALITDEEV